MLVYSTTINQFRKKVKSLAKEIMREEMHLPLYSGTAVLWGARLVDLDFAVFENDNKVLAYYDYAQHIIAFNLIWLNHTPDATFEDILRHELAHYALNEEKLRAAMHHHPFLGYAPTGEHDREFKAYCDHFWPGKNIGNATLELMTSSDPALNQHQQELKLLDKIKKLWALAESSNVHEAALAAAKANELLLKHNLQQQTHLRANLDTAENDEELTYQHIILTTAKMRTDPKLAAIYHIVKLFYVAPIFCRQPQGVVLSAVGSYHNLQVAEYVAHFMDRELDRLWANSPHHGNAARNSFFTGVAEGFESKIKAVQETVASRRELITLQDDLRKKFKQVFPHTRQQASSRRVDHHAQAAGWAAGRKLSINPALRRSTSSGTRLLT